MHYKYAVRIIQENLNGKDFIVLKRYLDEIKPKHLSVEKVITDMWRHEEKRLTRWKKEETEKLAAIRYPDFDVGNFK